MAMQGYLRRTATYQGTLNECQGLVAVFVRGAQALSVLLPTFMMSGSR